MLLAGALLLAGTIAVALPLLLDAQSERAARDAARERALRGERRREVARVQLPRSAAVPAGRGRSAGLTRALEARVLADARARRRTGELPDAATSARCRPFAASNAPPRSGVLILECLAYTGGGRTAYLFRARAVIPTGVITWCRNVLPPAHPDSAGQTPVALSTRCTGEGRAPGRS